MESTNPLISPERDTHNTAKSNQEIKEENEAIASKLHDEFKNRLRAGSFEESPIQQSQADKEIDELHENLKERLELEESEDSGESQDQGEQMEEVKFEDLDKIPDTTLIQKYKRMWNQLAMGPISKSAQKNLLTQLAKIDEKLQTIEKRELDKHFGGAYETYNYILRRFYEKLLSEKTKELKSLEVHFRQAQEELQKLEEELEKEENENGELRNKHSEELKKIEKELERFRQEVSERSKGNAELLKTIEDLNRDNLTLKSESTQLEQKLKEKEEELSKSALLLQDVELEKKKVETKFAITLERYEDIKNKDGDLETRNKQLGEAIHELQTSRQILLTYEEREKTLKQDIEESKREANEKTQALEALKEKYANEIGEMDTNIKKLEEENTKLKQTEETLSKTLKKHEEDLEKNYKEIEEKKLYIEKMKRELEQDKEKLQEQREVLEKRQEEFDRLKAIERGLEIHKEEIRKLIEENNFKREQVLKAIQDLASKGERFEEDKKRFELKVQEQTDSLKGEIDIKRRQDPGNKDYDTLPVCLGFLGGIILAIIGCWFAFGLIGRGVIPV